MPLRFSGEENDLEQVRAIGEKWGYGNCIQYLQYAWADSLIEKYPSIDRRTAALSAFMNESEIEIYIKGYSVIKNPSTKGLSHGKEQNRK